MRREDYNPGAADAAHIARKDGDEWTLVLTKEIRHSPERVWAALTEPAQLSQWSPFDANRNLSSVGPITLATVGAPSSPAASDQVRVADAPRVLVYTWGGREVRWELEADGTGTRLTLWTAINRRYVAMGAAGWHLCLDVMAFLLNGDAMGRTVAGDALELAGWQQLNREYTERFNDGD